MKTNTNAEALYECAKNGGNYEQIRQKALELGFESDSLKQIMREVDLIISEKMHQKNLERQLKEQIIFGCSIVLIGLTMTVYSWYSAYDSYLYIVYAAIAAAIYYTIKAYLQLKSPSQ